MLAHLTTIFAILTFWLPVARPPVEPAKAATLPRVPVLVYHHVDDKTGIWYVPIKTFEQQLAYLSENGFQTVSMAAYTAAFENGTPLPEKSVVLTFDDGYEDAYSTVFPLLKQYKFVGTFFIITGSVGQSGFLTWDQMKEMQQAGMEFGGHTVHHVFLSHLADLTAFWEMWQSRLDLEKNLGVPIQTFAYPFNDHNAMIIKLAALAGYKSACIVDLHRGDTEPNIFAVPRITIGSGEHMNIFEAVLKRAMLNVPSKP